MDKRFDVLLIIDRVEFLRNNPGVCTYGNFLGYDSISDAKDMQSRLKSAGLSCTRKGAVLYFDLEVNK